MNAAIYCRVSPTHQEEGSSLKTREASCRTQQAACAMFALSTIYYAWARGEEVGQ